MIVWAFETLLASTLLMLLVLAIRGRVRRTFGPNIAYALWALPAARMLLPPLPESWSEATPQPLAQASETIAYYMVEPLGVPTAEVAAAAPSLWPWVLAGWMAGAIVFIGYHLIAHDRFTRRIRRLARSVRIVAAGKVEVIETDAATGPLAFGILRKYVAFPRDFAERYDPLERDLALAHELGHHARGDLIANWIALVVLAAHWFNPVAWRAFRAFRADQEMACDALVLAGRAQGLRHAYGRAIVKSAHGGAVSAACHLHTINELKGRLKMLNMHEKKSRGRMLAGAGTIAALTIGSLGLTASGTQAAERVRTKVEKTIGVDLDKIEIPKFPMIPAFQEAPPAPPAPGMAPPPPAPEKKARRVVIVKDGVTTSYEGAEAEKYIAEKDLPIPPTPPMAPGAPGAKHFRMMMRDKDGKMTHLDGKGPHVLSHRFVFRDKDGKAKTWSKEGFPGMPPEALARLKNMPEISSRNCTDGEGKSGEHVVHSKDGDKKIVVICTNRIERIASMAAADAEKAHTRSFVFQRRAMGSALEGLRAARKSIQANRNMTDTQRSAALEGIDEAIREMADKPND